MNKFAKNRGSADANFDSLTKLLGRYELESPPGRNLATSFSSRVTKI